MPFERTQTFGLKQYLYLDVAYQSYKTDNNCLAQVAEWSKALEISQCFQRDDAPLGVGSNPALANFFLHSNSMFSKNRIFWRIFDKICQVDVSLSLKGYYHRFGQKKETLKFGRREIIIRRTLNPQYSSDYYTQKELSKSMKTIYQIEDLHPQN